MLRDAAATAACLLLGLSQLANAACECGYSVNKTSDSEFAVFTDLIENDFLHINTENLTEYGWQPQEYNVTAEAARGKFGKQMTVENSQTNPFKDANAWSGATDHSGDPGLQLWVRADHSNGLIGGAELAHLRNDSRYGSFRVGMKMSAVNGTCGAFYWYFDDSQEIDMEFLSKQFNDSQGAVNLVLQSPDSAKLLDASNTSTFRVAPLPFRPDEMYHEYRFDWMPDKVQFYVDGEFLWEMTEHVPVKPSRLFLNHWSNGDPHWSAGPPEKDTPMTVSYVKAYFNSTDEARAKVHTQNCPTFDPAKVCPIPAQKGAPDGANMETYFFSKDKTENKTPGQNLYKSGATSNLLGSSTTFITFLPLILALFSCAFSL
ncbi:concanavalin A-like lectin/glucanase [Westerdykella ornata]|uniref:Concanavalin A-like lectin/glucanase n=1 Tax=Westerdykella ornata TaxID=318751 RepID=A0A6A6J805_WESOR|nr:concanavalin A-like lectin/glucanase [Westerdykella ornata]KAF2272691.1 concanavalin A-like lectin/glucanase [Westerdykella ornata]